jgi:hypothetical protein
MSIHQSGKQKGARTIMVAPHEGLNFQDTLDILWKLFLKSKDRHGGFFEANMEVKWRPFGSVRDDNNRLRNYRIWKLVVGKVSGKGGSQ